MEFTKRHAETDEKTMTLVAVECSPGLADTPTKEHETEVQGELRLGKELIYSTAFATSLLRELWFGLCPCAADIFF